MVKKKVVNGKADIPVTETPVFVTDKALIVK